MLAEGDGDGGLKEGRAEVVGPEEDQASTITKALGVSVSPYDERV